MFDRTDLMEKIKDVKDQLNTLVTGSENLSSDEIIHVSRKLDKMLNEYDALLNKPEK
ncbi:MAG: aspartyl-phosphate phosphatase Spo0E family protein [Bacillota bacterium]|nr:aspartyl-phosphate phosphatase Spo0E family protein [Bacillota bacterium]